MASGEIDCSYRKRSQLTDLPTLAGVEFYADRCCGQVQAVHNDIPPTLGGLCMGGLAADMPAAVWGVVISSAGWRAQLARQMRANLTARN
jgi:hypothetical protein